MKNQKINSSDTKKKSSQSKPTSNKKSVANNKQPRSSGQKVVTKKQTRPTTPQKPEIKPKTIRVVQIAVIGITAVILLISAYNKGILPNYINQLFVYLLGEVYIIVGGLFILASLYNEYYHYKNNKGWSKYPYSLICITALFLLYTILVIPTELKIESMAQVISMCKIEDACIITPKVSVGVISLMMYHPLTMLLDRSLTLIAVLFVFISTMAHLVGFKRIANWFNSFARYIEDNLFVEDNDPIIKRQVSKPAISKQNSSIVQGKVDTAKLKPKSEGYTFPTMQSKSSSNNEDEYYDESFVEYDEIIDEDISEVVGDKLIEEVEDDLPVDITIDKKSVVERKPVIEKREISQNSNKANHKPCKNYKLPTYNLLDRFEASTDEDNIEYAEYKSEQLVQVLSDFRIESELIDCHIGPSVTKFEIRPIGTIKVSKILELQDNIKMELAVKDIRIEAPIPGKNTIGVEIPNKKTTMVKMRELLITERRNTKPMPKLSVLLGKNLLGETVNCDLAKMPHLLVAGATGSGKSVCMNTIIASILFRATPEEVKLVLIDPKKVEFSNFTELPHLISPVITDANEASKSLKVVVRIMDERYDLFAKAGAKNIATYNDKVINGKLAENYKKLPYIVVIIDELADLMLVAGKEVEGSIQRITQLARAAGIHLIVATQRPSTDVITGIIKANIPSRIAFAVSNGIDSKVILDGVGAEKLYGNGDMLYSPIGSSNLIRAQGVYISDEELERVVEYSTSQAKPMFDDAFIEVALEESADGSGNPQSKDPMYDEVLKYVVESQKASTSLLQRRFGFGYNRAARLIDVLEQNGIIGPPLGSKPREVVLKKI